MRLTIALRLVKSIVHCSGIYSYKSSINPHDSGLILDIGFLDVDFLDIEFLIGLKYWQMLGLALDVSMLSANRSRSTGLGQVRVSA
jgi:hypothetical protein